MFRANDYTAAQRPWQWEDLRGQVHTARLISQEQLLEYNSKVILATRGNDVTKDADLAEAIAARLLARAFWWLLRQAFPWRPSMLWRGDPVRRLFALDAERFDGARRDFFGSLARERFNAAELAAEIPRPTLSSSS